MRSQFTSDVNHARERFARLRSLVHGAQFRRPSSAIHRTDLGGIAALHAVAWPQRQHRALLWPGSACEELSRTVRQGTDKRPGVPEMLVAPTRGSVPVRGDGATEGSAVLEGLAFGVAERVSTASLFHSGINATV